MTACGSPSGDGADTTANEAATTMGTEETLVDPDLGSTGEDAVSADNSEPADAAASTFSIEVWADNWMAVYVDGVLIGEDSVPITTERSFNSEVFTFDATYPVHDRHRSEGLQGDRFTKRTDGCLG